MRRQDAIEDLVDWQLFAQEIEQAFAAETKVLVFAFDFQPKPFHTQTAEEQELQAKIALAEERAAVAGKWPEKGHRQMEIHRF
jgi:hypothetical protein